MVFDWTVWGMVGLKPVELSAEHAALCGLIPGPPALPWIVNPLLRSEQREYGRFFGRGQTLGPRGRVGYSERRVPPVRGPSQRRAVGEGEVGWLRVSCPTGFAPACHDTISRTHQPSRVGPFTIANIAHLARAIAASSQSSPPSMIGGGIGG